MLQSPPSRRRGLKCLCYNCTLQGKSVASFAEAWIEIGMSEEQQKEALRRLLRGGVD